MTKTSSIRFTSTTTRAGLAAIIVAGALAAGGGQATASPVNENGFINGPSCDRAEGHSLVIGETESSRFVLCQKNGSVPADVYYITENRGHPVQQRIDDAIFGQGIYVVNYQGGHKLLIGRDYVGMHNGVTGTDERVPAKTYKFEP